MKILFLNPQVDSEHKLVMDLQAKGYAVLVPDSVSEAWQMLQFHNDSVDLAVIHREGFDDKTPDGLELVKKLRADAGFKELPYILSSNSWGNAQFTEHQATALGANAYLRSPFSTNELLPLVNEILGIEDSQKGGAEPLTSLSLELSNVDIPAPKVDATQMGYSPVRGSAPSEDQALDIDFSPSSDESSLPTAQMSVEAAELPSTLSVGSSDLEAYEQLSEPAKPEVSMDVDGEAASELPYLFQPKQAVPSVQDFRAQQGALYGMQPLGDAVVPGGASQSPDLETVKKYLLLREQDVAVLSSLVQDLKQQLAKAEERVKQEQANTAQYEFMVEDQKKKIDQFEFQRKMAEEGILSELNEMKFQMKVKNDKVRVLESEVRGATEDVVKIKERVKIDLRRIRVRERELENRLEVMKRDYDALLNLREAKIIELKRKMDLMEFNLDVTQEQYSREKEHSEKLKEQLGKAAQAIRVAGGLLGSKEILAAAEMPIESHHDNKERAAS